MSVMSTNSPQTDESKKIEPIKYSPKEHNYYGKLVKRLCDMRDERDRPHSELDGMTYLEYYDNNRRKDLAYIAPKTNRNDIRISSGVIREKDTSLVSTIMNLELNPDIRAFDKDDNFVNELGTSLNDLVKKSREIEDWDLYRGKIYRELFSQGDVFVEEIYSETYSPVVTSNIEWNPTKNKVEDFKVKSIVKKTGAKCKARMLDGRKVYLASMKKEYVKDQDAVAILNIYSREEAESMYGTWARWKHVPTTIETVQAFESDSQTYKSWNMIKLSGSDDVAEIKIFDKVSNRFMILLNGVMMLPIDYPLTAISPTGEIPISQGKCEIISEFAYGKSIPSKNKVDESVLDEMKKLMIRKMRQSNEPPKGSRKSKVHSRDIFNPGKITYDIQEGDLFDLINNPGITSADFSFYQLVQEDINNKSLNDVASGEGVQGDPTATQVLEEKQQALIKLGLALDGVLNLERQMVWNRIHGLLFYWTKPVSAEVDDIKNEIKKIYKTISVNTTVDNGENGIKQFKFTTDQFPDKRTQEDEEEALSKEQGKPVRVIYMNPELLKTVKLTWYVMITATPKSNDALSVMLFVQNITQAANLFGIESLNLDYLKQRYAILIKEDFSKMFVDNDVLKMIMEKQALAEAEGTTPKKKAPTKELAPVVN
jgi:hypothetical protein